MYYETVFYCTKNYSKVTTMLYFGSMLDEKYHIVSV